jgi:hypothetical protein
MVVTRDSMIGNLIFASNKEETAALLLWRVNSSSATHDATKPKPLSHSQTEVVEGRFVPVMDHREWQTVTKSLGTQPVTRTGLFLTNWPTFKSASRRKATTSAGRTEPLIEMSTSTEAHEVILQAPQSNVRCDPSSSVI